MLESKIYDLAVEVKTMKEKFSQLETKVTTKDDLTEQLKSLKEELAEFKFLNMILKNRLKMNDDDFLNIVSPKEKLYFIDSLYNNVSKKLKMCLYNPKKDGDDGNIFHKNCDNKGPLLYVIVATNNSVFGIYISQPISSDGSTKTDSIQMIISPTHHFAIKSLNTTSTYHNEAGKGPRFHCMQINAPFLTSNCTDIQSCSDFNLPCYPTGNSSYQIKEFEVYSLEDI